MEDNAVGGVDEAIQRMFEAWRLRFPEPMAMEFAAPALVNPYCPECRFCCGPQPEDEPFPMALLDSQVGAGNEERFYMLDANTASLDGRGCKSCGPQGCLLERADRPPACNLFPFVIVDMKLYLYRVCPASLFSSEEELRVNAGKAAAWIDSLPAEDVRRISIRRRPEDLRMKYMDLGIEVSGR